MVYEGKYCNFLYYLNRPTFSIFISVKPLAGPYTCFPWAGLTYLSG